MRTTMSVLLFISAYLLVAMGPVIAIMCANYLIDPSIVWVCVADDWLSAKGVPYAPLALTVGYCLMVFYPAIRFALHTCGPMFLASRTAARNR